MTSSPPFGLPPATLEKLNTVFAAHPVIESVLIYGSRAKGNYQRGSDIDLCIKGEELPFVEFVQIEDQIDDLMLPYTVDLSQYRQIENPDLIAHIDRVGVAVYAREDLALPRIEVIGAESGKMGISEWREVKLGEVSEVTSSKRIFYSDYVSAGVPFWRSKEVIEKFNGKPISTDLYISPEKYFEIKAKFGVPKKNDILLTSVGTLGIPYLVQDDEAFYFKDGNLTWIRNIDDARLHPKYLYKWIASQAGRDSLREITIGSTQEALTIVGLKNLNLLLPPVREQKAIAAVLSDLDDKIDLLHSQNKTLEAMAETLFRQWFVEEAKENNEESSLLNFVELVGGGTPKTSMPEYWGGNIPWLSGGDISTNHKGFVSASEKSITTAGLDNSSAKLLPKFATVISARGTVGKYCMLASDMAFSQSNYGILPRISGCYFFTYLLVNHVVEELQSAAYGSVFDTITTSTFREARFAIPPIDKVQEFDCSVASIFGKKLENQKQIRILETLRDTLLPKLMSGEVRVALDA